MNDNFSLFIEDYLSLDQLKDLQAFCLSLNYEPKSNCRGNYAFRYDIDCSSYVPHFNFIVEKMSSFLKINLKKYNMSICCDLRNNKNNINPHFDTEKYNLLLQVKGEPLFNNGTGFWTSDGHLSAHVGFLENRCLFFTGDKMLHGNIQPLGDSSPRYTFLIFFG